METLVWKSTGRPVPYPDAVAAMESTVAGMHASDMPETVWLLEHPAVYTAGTSAPDDELLSAHDIPVYRTGRGGRFTYHGPGQQIAYVMVDLTRRGRDVHRYVEGLENWIIATLAHFGVRGERRQDRVGVWVVGKDGQEDKIAAIGVRVRRWITFYGISINRDPDLSHFDGIVPCGIREHGVTSLRRLGLDVSRGDLEDVMRTTFIDAMPPHKAP
ncbi:MAG: lipoate-protein ligase B [Rhodospirillaceae bacterium]|nr:lipoate-protein ligase B [Rhodospirillaceae bacterium]|tara:strand:- start:23205 stop:23849 length:645 start_codon:yes stop_codon:yes gene_type:complete